LAETILARIPCQLPPRDEDSAGDDEKDVGGWWGGTPPLNLNGESKGTHEQRSQKKQRSLKIEYRDGDKGNPASRRHRNRGGEKKSVVRNDRGCKKRRKDRSNFDTVGLSVDERPGHKRKKSVYGKEGKNLDKKHKSHFRGGTVGEGSATEVFAGQGPNTKTWVKASSSNTIIGKQRLNSHREETPILPQKQSVKRLRVSEKQKLRILEGKRKPRANSPC